MNVIAIEKETSIKSSISTAAIVTCMALILWLYKININMPISFSKAAHVEMVFEPSIAGGNGSEGPTNKTYVPVEASGNKNLRSMQETQDELAVKQKKTDEPVDNSIQEMLHNRNKARSERENSKSGNDKGK